MNLINIICSTNRAAVNKFLKLSNFENIESSFHRLMEKKTKSVNDTFSLKSSLTLTLSEQIRESPSGLSNFLENLLQSTISKMSPKSTYGL